MGRGVLNSAQHAALSNQELDLDHAARRQQDFAFAVSTTNRLIKKASLGSNLIRNERLGLIIDYVETLGSSEQTALYRTIAAL
jgi:hypothetical protein